MAIDYDTDIFTALWTGAEDSVEPYVSIISENPDLFDTTAELRVLSTVEAIRSHIELLAGRREARVLHFCLATMLESLGSGGFVYGANDSGFENAIAEGNIVEPVFLAADDIEFAALSGVSAGASIAVVAVGGGTLADLITAINGTGALTAVGITASRTQDGRLRITQVPVGGTAADGFVITHGEGAANDEVVDKAGIATIDGTNPTQSGLAGGIFIPKVREVANNARDRAVEIFLGQIRPVDIIG